MDRNGPVLAKLLLRLMHLSQEVDEALAVLRHALLRPVRELELADRPRRTVARVRYLGEGV